MQLVEQHCISKQDPRYGVIDEAAFKSKNLYNAALYELRQTFIHEGKYLNYNEMKRHMQSSFWNCDTLDGVSTHGAIK